MKERTPPLLSRLAGTIFLGSGSERVAVQRHANHGSTAKKQLAQHAATAPWQQVRQRNEYIHTQRKGVTGNYTVVGNSNPKQINL